MNGTLIHVKATLPSVRVHKDILLTAQAMGAKGKTLQVKLQVSLYAYSTRFEMTYMLALPGQKSKKIDKGKRKADPELERTIENTSKGERHALGHREGKRRRRMCTNCPPHPTDS